MGCPCSKLDEDRGGERDDDQGGGDVEDDRHCNYAEALSQCKQRKDLLRQASAAGRAFAKSHAEYLQSLARIGCALQDFLTEELHLSRGAHGDLDVRAARSVFAIEYTPLAPQRVVLDDEFLIKPPPPPPGCPSRYWDFDFFQQVEQSIHAAEVSMARKLAGEDGEDDLVIELEGDEVKIIDREDGKKRSGSGACATAEERTSSASEPSNEEDQRLAIVPAELSRDDVEKFFRYVYQEFLRASQSGGSVTAILQSGKELSLALTRSDCKFGWSQALTLESLSAWELKLYEEVKALSEINTEFVRKRKLLCKYGVNRVHDEAVDRTRADVKAIESQMSVAVQAMEATAAAVQKITNEELHFQLLELVQGLAEMWSSIHDCHERQRIALLDLRLDRSGAARDVSPGQKNAVHKLQLALASWAFSLETLLVREKEYIAGIAAWIRASISKLSKLRSLSRRKSRVAHLAIPEIFYLCQEWERCLIDLCSSSGGGGRERSWWRRFADAVGKIEQDEGEQMKAQRRLEGLEKDLGKKVASVRGLEEKMRRKDVSGVLAEKRAGMEAARELVEEERRRVAGMSSSRVRATLGTIQDCLPELFAGAGGEARILAEAHGELHRRGRQGIKQSIVI